MNIVFYLLVAVAAVALWFLLSFIFRPIGKYICKLFRDAKDEINKD